MFHFPISLVDVWAVLELLFHVIVVCTATVSDDGLKVFPAIAIVLVDGVSDGGAVGLDELFLHPLTNTNSILAVMTEKPKNSLYIMYISFIMFFTLFIEQTIKDIRSFPDIIINPIEERQSLACFRKIHLISCCNRCEIHSSERLNYYEIFPNHFSLPLLLFGCNNWICSSAILLINKS